MYKYSKERIDAINAYNKENMVQVCIKLSKKSEADLIERIFSQNSKSRYIKDLVKADLENQKKTI